MADAELREQLLTRLYNQRSEDWAQIGIHARGSPEQKEEIRIAKQLEEYGLIEFKVFNRLIGGPARITAKGVDVIEGTTRSPIAMNIDRRQTVNISGSTNIQIGDRNIQEIRNSIVWLVNSIEKSEASFEQKEGAKGLLQRFLEHPLVTSIVGAAIGSVMK